MSAKSHSHKDLSNIIYTNAGTCVLKNLLQAKACMSYVQEYAESAESDLKLLSEEVQPQSVMHFWQRCHRKVASITLSQIELPG